MPNVSSLAVPIYPFIQGIQWSLKEKRQPLKQEKDSYIPSMCQMPRLSQSKILEQGTKIYTKMVSVSLETLWIKKFCDKHIKSFSIIWWVFLDQLLYGLESAIVCRFPV